jgi:hypothetical protein
MTTTFPCFPHSKMSFTPCNCIIDQRAVSGRDDETGSAVPISRISNNSLALLVKWTWYRSDSEASKIAVCAT